MRQEQSCGLQPSLALLPVRSPVDLGPPGAVSVSSWRSLSNTGCDVIERWGWELESPGSTPAPLDGSGVAAPPQSPTLTRTDHTRFHPVGGQLCPVQGGGDRTAQVSCSLGQTRQRLAMIPA